jgi:hypothetical protein
MASSSPLSQPAFTWLRDLLWPESDGAQEVVATYAVLSRGDRPRLVLPLGSNRAAATALGRVTNDESKSRRTLRRLLATSARAGVLLPLLRHRFVSTAGTGGSLEGHLAQAVGLDHVELAITIGPPRPNRKPVIQIMDESGETKAYAKVGWNGLTRQLVAQEAEVLRSVDRTGLHRLRLPAVVHSGSFRDLDLLVVQALQPGPGETTELRDPTAEEVSELRSLRTERRNPLPDDAYWTGLLTRIDRLGGTAGDELARQAHLVAGGLGGAPVVFAGAHGDWTPWNMVATDRHLYAWDWERAVREIPFPLDVIHYHTQRGWFRSGLPLDAAIADGVGAARTALADAGLPRDHAAWLARLYLVDLAVRYAENALAGTDELLSNQYDEVMHTLQSHHWLAG